MDRNNNKSKKRNPCLCHAVLSAKGKVTPFAIASWRKIKEAALIRKDDIYIQNSEYLEHDSPHGSYHRQCYQRYTNKEHLQRIKKKRCPENSSNIHASPPKRLKRSDVLPGSRQKEKICFICRKIKKLNHEKKSYEFTISVMREDVEEKIKNAARIRKDERVLLDVEGQDLKAIGYYYHRTCYARYTNIKTLTNLTKQETPNKDNFQEAFKKVCEIIDDSIIGDRRTLEMSYLRDQYRLYLGDQSVSNSCRTSKLKKRIITAYGDKVKFVQPQANHSEFIFSSELEVADVMIHLLKQDQGTDETLSEEDPDIKTCHGLYEGNMADIYNCGILIHKIIKGIKSNIAWPPSPDDVSKENIHVPDLLYNLLAYIITGDLLPVYEGKVKVMDETDRLITSLAQDMISVTRKGHIKTVKNLGLGIAVRNLTGNKEVLVLLNKFGHTLSYNAILEYENLLVKKLHDEQMNTLILPSGTSKRAYSTFVWDNNDLCEETLSGEGTTHVTNGIIIQQKVSFTFSLSNLIFKVLVI